MRDFFKSELETLKAKTGLNQYENMSAMPDAAFQFKVLLDSLVLVCEKFPMIPDEAKKSIIRDKMITDPEFNNLNSRKVWAWMEGQRAYYMTRNETGEVVEPEIVFPELTEQEKKELDEELHRRKLAAMGERVKFPGLELTMKQIVTEDKERVEKKRGTPDPRPVFVVDVTDEHGNLIQTVENVKASTPEKAIEIATDYVKEKLKI